MITLRTIPALITITAAVSMSAVLISQQAFIAGAFVVLVGAGAAMWMYSSPLAGAAALAGILGVALAARGQWTEACGVFGYAASSVVLQSLRRGEESAQQVPTTVH